MFYKYQKIYDNLDNYIFDNKTNNKLFSKNKMDCSRKSTWNKLIYYDGKECQFAKRNNILKKMIGFIIIKSYKMNY